MELDNQRASGNVEDRRGLGIGVGGGLGVGGIIVAVVAYFLGVDPRTALNVAEQVAPPHQQQGYVGSATSLRRKWSGSLVVRIHCAASSSAAAV